MIPSTQPHEDVTVVRRFRLVRAAGYLRAFPLRRPARERQQAGREGRQWLGRGRFHFHGGGFMVQPALEFLHQFFHGVGRRRGIGNGAHPFAQPTAVDGAELG